MQQSLQQWIESITSERIQAVSAPAAFAGQNVVWIVELASGLKVVARCTPMGRLDFALSGISIRAELSRIGIRVPKTLATWSGLGYPDPCHLSELNLDFVELMEFIEGEDLEVCWRTLESRQALDLSLRAAQVVDSSCECFDQSNTAGFGLARMGQDGPHDSWTAWCKAWLSWVSRMGVENGLIETFQIHEVEQLFSRAWHLFDQAKRDVFIWDVAERNVMVKDGKWVGLVDQDVLMSGDKMVVPALARIALEFCACPWAGAYEASWLNALGASEDDHKRQSMYRVLYAMQFTAKGNRLMPDGRVTPIASKSLLATAIQECRALLY